MTHPVLARRHRAVAHVARHDCLHSSLELDRRRSQVSDGKIDVWRDYFDMNQLTTQMK